MIHFRLCSENELRSGTVDGKIGTVDGKIVFYNDFSLGGEALAGKAAGMIVSTIDYGDFSIIYPLPATLLYYSDAEKVKSYINRARYVRNNKNSVCLYKVKN